MRELRDSGVIGAIGLGVNECQVCEEVLSEADLDVVLLAGRYTLLEQDSLETFLPLATRRDVRIVLGGPYSSGILATGVRGRADVHYNYEPAPADIVARVGTIEDVCAAHGVPLAAAALQFPLAHPQVVSVIPGMGSARHVARALELMTVSIPDDLWRDLKAQGLIRSDAPTPMD
jgi:D-threo-aldose 1-dehydrogenase